MFSRKLRQQIITLHNMIEDLQDKNRRQNVRMRAIEMYLLQHESKLRVPEPIKDFIYYERRTIG